MLRIVQVQLLRIAEVHICEKKDEKTSETAAVTKILAAARQITVPDNEAKASRETRTEQLCGIKAGGAAPGVR